MVFLTPHWSISKATVPHWSQKTAQCSFLIGLAKCNIRPDWSIGATVFLIGSG